MASLTDFAAEQVLNWLTAQPVTAPSPPFMVALLTVPGDDIGAGTEVIGGGYSRQTFIPTPASTSGGGLTSVRNATLIRFSNMPAITVNGFAIYDSAPTPVRWVHALLSQPRTFALGDPAEFAVGDLVITGD
jgi:hypothetical protein